MIGNMRNSIVTEKSKCQKIDKYFYRDPNGNILKYSHYCIEKNCKTESSYNYGNLKQIYCNKHKLEKMVNVKRGHKLCQNCNNGYKIKCNTPKCKYTIKNYKDVTKYTKQKIIKYLKENNIEFYMYRICSQIVDKEHFESQEHIKKFNSVCKINIEKSLEDNFIKIKCKIIDIRYNLIYTGLYFKKHIREITFKNIDTLKYYKSFIIKQNMLQFNHGSMEPIYVSEKFDSSNILQDISNIENIERKKQNLKPYLIKNAASEYNYKIKKMEEDITKINFKKSGDSIYNINNVGCDIFILECQLLKCSNYNFENILKIFYKSKVISVIKNKDEKCFIYCYIRKFLNNVDKNHPDRVSSKDKVIAKKLEEELNFNFDNVKVKDLNKIEDLLETNIDVYTCNKNLKNRLPVYKSDKDYEKFLDLLLFENHYMNIINISRFFYPDEKNKIFFVERIVTNVFSKKYKEHLQLCQINNPMILMPSQNKYLQFKNLKNTNIIL